MRVEAVELFNIELPLKAPERTNYGTNFTRSVVLVKVTSGGVSGWGEAAPLSDPTWNYEYPGTTWPILQDYLIPAVLDQNLDRPQDVLQSMRASSAVGFVGTTSPRLPSRWQSGICLRGRRGPRSVDFLEACAIGCRLGCR